MEDCQMVEEEAHWIEEEKAQPDQSGPGEEATDIKMVDQEELGDPEFSGTRMEADTEDNPPLASGGDTISPEEEAILFGQTPQPEDWQLDLTAPGVRLPRSQEGWQSYISHPQPTLGLRRERPHMSLLFSNKL